MTKKAGLKIKIIDLSDDSVFKFKDKDTKKLKKFMREVWRKYD